MKATFRPIQWTAPTTLDRRSRYIFKAPWSSTLQLLDRELEYLDAENLVIQADFAERDLRLDGMPKERARQPEFPGVRILFDSRHGPLVYETDAYEFWQHNVRAIALALEALRAVDRYGVTHHAEQYKGWRAIEAGPAVGTMSDRAAAAMFVATYSAPIGTSITAHADELLRGLDSGTPQGEGLARVALRVAAKRCHPDTGGSADRFRQLQEAREVLGL